MEFRSWQRKRVFRTMSVLSLIHILENYDELREQAEKELEQAEAVLKEHSEALSAARKQFAGELVEKIADGLRELNFLDVQFEMEFRRLDHFTAGGIDEPEFLISTNPGEPVRPLGMVAVSYTHLDVYKRQVY